MLKVSTKWENDEYLIDDEDLLDEELNDLDEDEAYIKESLDPEDEEDDSYNPYEEDDEY